MYVFLEMYVQATARLSYILCMCCMLADGEFIS